MDSQIELAELQKAVASLRAALSIPKNDIARDATIQRFEFCIELAWKVAKKVLGSSTGAPKSIVREMGQDGLIDDVERWLDYVNMRNLTVHTYREALAEEVYAKCRLFLPDAENLLKRLEGRLS